MSTVETEAGTGRAGERKRFYGRPFMWLLFAVTLALLPLAGYMLQADMTWDQVHPALNAMLNGAGTVFLIAGFIAIRGRDIAFHKSCMIAACSTSSLFLVSYLIRYALSGSHHYPGDGADKAIYLVILFSHMVLATLVVPMVGRTLYLALRGRFDKHRALARWTWPIWLYVSVTGVLVYFMLYPIAGALYGS